MDITKYIYITENGEKIYPTVKDGKVLETGEEVWNKYKDLCNKQIDICPTKTNQELQEEISSLKDELAAVTERLSMQQEMSSIAMEYIYGSEAVKND